jgi:hypothetical protein
MMSGGESNWVRRTTMNVQFTRILISSCDGGPCPGIIGTDDPEMFGVRGARLSEAEIATAPGETPSHETVILVPRWLLDRWAREQS